MAQMSDRIRYGLGVISSTTGKKKKMVREPDMKCEAEVAEVPDQQENAEAPAPPMPLTSLISHGGIGAMCSCNVVGFNPQHD